MILKKTIPKPGTNQGRIGRVFFVNKARNLYFRLVDGILDFYYNGTN